MRNEWSKKEKSELRRQFLNSIPLENIKIENRSYAAVRYQSFRLKLFTKKWKRNEISYIKKVISGGGKPEEIELSGRTKQAIRNKLIRLKIWETKKRITKSWTTKEIGRLKHLVTNTGYTAKMLVESEYFFGRTQDSISQQMRRQHIRKSF